MAANSRPARQGLHREILAEGDQGEDTAMPFVIKLEATLLSSSATLF